jgi:hypothetical protein
MILLPIISLGFLILFLMGALISFQYFTHYQSLMVLERSHIEDQRQRAQTALGFLVAFSFGAVIALGGIIYPAIIGYTPSPIQPPPTDIAVPGISPTLSSGDVPGNPTPENTSAPESIEPTPQLTSTSNLARATIGNTGGAGANIRSSPGLSGTIIVTLADGTRVFLLGENQTVDGYDWQYIEMPDTREGWVVVQYLILE